MGRKKARVSAREARPEISEETVGAAYATLVAFWLLGPGLNSLYSLVRQLTFEKSLRAVCVISALLGLTSAAYWYWKWQEAEREMWSWVRASREKEEQITELKSELTERDLQLNTKTKA